MSKRQVVAHYNYLSMRRVHPAYLPCGKLPKWYDKYDGKEFSHEYHEGHNKPIKMTPDIESQRKMGVLVNATWIPRRTPVKSLAQYCAFDNPKDMTAYIDVIKFHEFIETNRFYAIPPDSAQNTNFSDEFVRPSPTKVLKAYYLNNEVHDFVDQIIKLCPQPTFLPVQMRHFHPCYKDSDPLGKHLHPEAFVLAAAAQILLFAPQDWKPDRVYSRDSTEYEYRFPTRDNIGGGTDQVVGSKYSMEDLHRAILMFYRLVDRRSEGGWLAKRQYRDAPSKFPGYHDPDKPQD
ncbi:hypothetical protein ACHAPY_010042 [Fusarium culmorum]